jgi:hypothetical protein
MRRLADRGGLRPSKDRFFRRPPSPAKRKTPERWFPSLKFGSAGTCEGQMIEPRTALIERLGTVEVGEPVNGDERSTHRPNNLMERTGVLVKDRI